MRQDDFPELRPIYQYLVARAHRDEATTHWQRQVREWLTHSPTSAASWLLWLQGTEQARQFVAWHEAWMERLRSLDRALAALPAGTGQRWPGHSARAALA